MITTTPLHIPPKKKLRRVAIKYYQGGSLLKVKINQSLYTNMQGGKESLDDASGMSFNQSIFMRAALAKYLVSLKAMDTDELKREAYLLQNLFR